MKAIGVLLKVAAMMVIFAVLLTLALQFLGLMFSLLVKLISVFVTVLIGILLFRLVFVPLNRKKK